MGLSSWHVGTRCIVFTICRAGFSDLDDEGKLVFERLLTCDDPDLFAWFMGHQTCEDKELAGMVDHILARVKV